MSSENSYIQNRYKIDATDFTSAVSITREDECTPIGITPNTQNVIPADIKTNQTIDLAHSNMSCCVCGETCSRCWQSTPLFQLSCFLLPCICCCQCLSDGNNRYCCFEDNGDEIYYTYTGRRTCF